MTRAHHSYHTNITPTCQIFNRFRVSKAQTYRRSVNLSNMILLALFHLVQQGQICIQWCRGPWTHMTVPAGIGRNHITYHIPPNYIQQISNPNFQKNSAPGSVFANQRDIRHRCLDNWTEQKMRTNDQPLIVAAETPSLSLPTCIFLAAVFLNQVRSMPKVTFKHPPTKHQEKIKQRSFKWLFQAQKKIKQRSIKWFLKSKRRSSSVALNACFKRKRRSSSVASSRRKRQRSIKCWFQVQEKIKRSVAPSGSWNARNDQAA